MSFPLNGKLGQTTQRPVRLHLQISHKSEHLVTLRLDTVTFIAREKNKNRQRNTNEQR